MHTPSPCIIFSAPFSRRDHAALAHSLTPFTGRFDTTDQAAPHHTRGEA